MTNRRILIIDDISNCGFYCDGTGPNGDKLRKRPSFVVQLETGNAPVSPTAPANPPSGNPGIAHLGVLKEQYEDRALLWVRDCIGNSWSLAQTTTCSSRTTAGVPVVVQATGTNTFTIPAPTGGNTDLNSIQVHINGNIQYLGQPSFGYTTTLNGDGSVSIIATQSWGTAVDPDRVAIYYNIIETIC